MASGLQIKLVGQTGEYLACAELSRRGYIATSFTGNVPEFDLIVCDNDLNTIPIQVKTSSAKTWPSRADYWMDIKIDDKQKKQVLKGKKEIQNPDLIYINILLGKDRSNDRFFILQKKDIQNACITAYKEWMDPKDWKRPKNYESFDNRYGPEHIKKFENNWGLIKDLLVS